MSRRARHYVPGFSVHVVQRGHNRMSVFDDDEDHESFMALLQAAADRHIVDVHAYALMKTHYHVIMTPRDAVALAGAMKEVGTRYVRHYNRKYGHSGTIWSSRYRSFLLTDERYWLTCLRYVEQNPVRAQMVLEPQAYRWSSYGVHAHGIGPGWLTLHALYLGLGTTAQDRQCAYRALCNTSLTDADLVRQRLGVGYVAVGDGSGTDRGRSGDRQGTDRGRIGDGLGTDHV